MQYPANDSVQLKKTTIQVDFALKTEMFAPLCILHTTILCTIVRKIYSNLRNAMSGRSTSTESSMQ